MLMLAEEFRPVNGKSVPFAHLRKPTGKLVNWNGRARNWHSIGIHSLLKKNDLLLTLWLRVWYSGCMLSY